MEEEKENSNYSFFKIMRERKFYYVVGFGIGLLIGFLNTALGKDINLIDLFIIPFGCSFPFGYLLYVFIKEPEKIKKYGLFFVFLQHLMPN